MRKTLFALVTSLLLLIPSLAHAVAESCTESAPVHACGDIWYVEVDCTADSADASFDTQVTTKSYCGWLLAFTTDPGATGPTDNSDLDLYHTVADVATTAEMLGAQGDDIIDNATNNHVTLTTKVAVCGPIGIDMQNNAVNSGNFKLRMYFEIAGTD